jgi:hypothetical protein
MVAFSPAPVFPIVVSPGNQKTNKHPHYCVELSNAKRTHTVRTHKKKKAQRAPMSVVPIPCLNLLHYTGEGLEYRHF